MKKILLIVLGLVLIFNSNIEATTKQDILDFVNAQSVGDDKTAVVFNSYKTTFTRLLKQKELSSSDCDRILSNLNTAVGILNSRNVSKISDLNKLTAQEKSTIYNSLTEGASIITNAPAIGSSSNSNVEDSQERNNQDSSNTTVSIDTSEGTVDIYESGVLIDKISTEINKFTYTGPSKTKIVIIVVSIVLLISFVLIYIILRNKTQTATINAIKTFSVSVIICSATILSIVLVFSSNITKIEDILAMVKFTDSGATRDIELGEDNKIITYPSYGNNYAKLLIETLGIEKDIVYGEDTELLKSSVCQATWSDFPTEQGLVVLSGHNSENMLRNIEKIAMNDEIIIDSTYAKCTYVVYRTKIVEETEIEALSKDTDKETVIIYTCYPFSEYIYGSKRFVVYANLRDIEWK